MVILYKDWFKGCVEIIDYDEVFLASDASDGIAGKLISADSGIIKRF